MKLKYALKFMFFLFCVVTTFEIILIGILSLAFDTGFALHGWDFFRVPLVGFGSVLPSLIYVRSSKKGEISRTGAIVRTATHFVLTMGIVFGLLVYYGWLDASNAAINASFFLVVYACAYTFQELRNRKLAKRLNEQINAFHDAKNETRHDEP